jgi:hypothetical protein
MLWTILRPSPNMCLHDVTSIQKRKLSIRLYPYFVPCVLCEDGKSGDVEAEFASLGELA